MRRLILILATVALPAVGSAAPAGAVETVPLEPPYGTKKGDGKPGVTWLLGVLDGNKNATWKDVAKARAAIIENL